MPQAMLASAIMVLICVLVHYETLRLLSGHLPRLTHPPRRRILYIIVGAFVAHTVEIWLWGVAYWALLGHFDLGSLTGISGTLYECVYFSSVTYTTLGFGDVNPVGPLRLLAGAEALTGLILIGWTVTFTFFAMRDFWDLH